MAPSTEWREQIEGDEEQRFAGFAERIVAMQKKKSERYGNGRAFHRKQIRALRADCHLERPGAFVVAGVGVGAGLQTLFR